MDTLLAARFPLWFNRPALIWLLKDFDLLSVLLRAATLALEALTLGGVAFLLLAALPARTAPETERRLRTVTAWAALALAIAQVLSLSASSAILIGGSGFSFRDVATADFFFLGALLVVGALAVFFLMRALSRRALFACIPFALFIL